MNDKDKALMISLLNTAGAAIEAAFSLIAKDEPEEPQECQHPQESRKDYSTMGTKRWQCGECGFLYEEES